MSFSRTTKRIAGWAPVLAALAVYGAWTWRLRNEAEMRVRHAEAVEARGLGLQGHAADMERQARAAQDKVKASSNRMAELERQLEAEKTTHEPLRRQIEKMLAEQIALKDSLALDEKVIKELRESLAEGGQKNSDLKAQNQTQQDRIVKLDADLKAANEREATARAQISEHRAGADEARAKLADVQSKLNDALQRLEASERTVADLRARAAAQAAAATNAPASGVTGSSAP
jgi:chromosome segregation ATPase